MTGLSLVVVGSRPTAAGDPDVHVGRALADRLGGRYHLVVPAGAHPPGRYDAQRVSIHRVPAGNRLDYVVDARRIVDGIPRDPPRVLMSSNPVAAIVLETSRARRACPHIFHVQGDVVTPSADYGVFAKRVALRGATRLGLRRASAVRVVSEHLRSAVLPWAAGPVEVLGSRVDTTRFQPADRYGAGGHAVMVGALEPVKNQVAVVRAWP